MNRKKNTAPSAGMTYWRKDHEHGFEAIADDGMGNMLYVSVIQDVAGWNWVRSIPADYYETTMEAFQMLRDNTEQLLQTCLIGSRPC